MINRVIFVKLYNRWDMINQVIIVKLYNKWDMINDSCKDENSSRSGIFPMVVTLRQQYDINGEHRRDTHPSTDVHLHQSQHRERQKTRMNSDGTINSITVCYTVAYLVLCFYSTIAVVV